MGRVVSVPARKDEMEYSSNEMVKHNRNAASSAGEQMGSVTYQVVQQNLEMWLARWSADGCGSGAGVVRRVVWAANSEL